MIKIIYRAIIIVFISAGLGLAYNSLSRQGIPLFSGQPKPDERFKPVSLQEVRMKFEAYQSIFVDARSKEDFIEGHIPGAINLPYDNFETAYQQAINVLTPLEREIIVYCQGEDCHSSDIVAEDLSLLGHTEVKIFFSGWPAWLEAGYEKEKGEADKKSNNKEHSKGG